MIKTAIVLMLISYLLSGCSNQEEDLLLKNQSSTYSNICNGATFTKDGEWIYYINRDTGEILKMKENMKDEMKITEGDFNSVNIVGDWIYTVIRTKGIYRIKRDGTKIEKISDKAGGFLNVVDDWIYISYNNMYKRMFNEDVDKTENGIYKISVDGKKEIKLTNDVGGGMAVKDDWIYYSLESIPYPNEIPIATDDGKIFRMKTDGTNRQKISDIKTSYMILDGEYIYYPRGYSIHRVKVDGSEHEEINVLTEREQSLKKPIIELINIHDNWIYVYSEEALIRETRRELYKVDLYGRNKKTLYRGWIKNLNVIGDYVYFYDIYKRKVIRLKKDGADERIIYTEKLPK